MGLARKELSDFIERTADKVYFVENESAPFNPSYRSIFTSTPLQGREVMESSGLFNVNFQKRIDYEKLTYTDPSSGRRIYGKKELYVAATKIPRRLTDGMDVRRPSDELRNFVAGWSRAAMNKYRLELQQFAMKHLNVGGHTAGNDIFDGTNDVQTDPNGGLLYDGTELLNLTGNSRSLLRLPGHLSSNAFFNNLGATGADLTSTNFETAYQKVTMDNAYDDAGQRIVQVPTHLIVPPSLRSDAFQIIKTSSGLPGDVNNGANPNFEIVDIIVDPFLTDTDAWFLYANTGMWKIFDQEPPRFISWIDNETDVVHLKMEVAYGSMISAWQCVAGGNIATS